MSSSTSSSEGVRRPANESFRSYIAIAIAAITLPLAGTGALNLLVDPGGVFGVFALDLLDDARRLNTRIGRGELLADGGYETLLLGSSRIIRAIDVEHPAFAGRRVMNGGLKGTNIYELDLEFRYALETNELEEIVFFTDFLMFHEGATTASDFEASRLNPQNNPLDYYLEKLFGLRSIYGAISTINRHRTRGSAKTRPAGDGQRHRSFEKVVDQFLTSPVMYGGYRYGTTRIAIFEEMLSETLERGLDTRIVIVPIHASLLEAIHLTGNWPNLEQWRRDLVRAVDSAHRRVPGSPRPEIWDFADYSHFSTETIPPALIGPNPQKWWRDPSHMKGIVGDRILDRIYGRPVDEADLIGLPGWQLSQDTIEARLLELREHRQTYLSTHPADAEWVARKYSGAAPPVAPASSLASEPANAR